MTKQGIIVLVVLLVLAPACRKTDDVSTKSAGALRLYSEGVSQYERFCYAEAKSLFQRALTEDSTFVMAWVRLAMVHRASGNQPEAKSSIQKAIEYAPAATRYEQLVVRLWNHWIENDFKQAARASDSLITEFPRNKEAYLVRGNLYEVSRKLDAAIRMYEKAVEIDTAYALAFMSLGYAYSAIGEPVRALAEMERYIRLAPDVADTRASYADLLYRYGRYDEAEEQYKRSLDLKPDYWYAINRIGDVYFVIGRLQDARSQWNQGYKLMLPSKKVEASRIALDARIELERANYAEAERLCLRALEVDSANGSAAFVLASALIRQKDWKRAETVISTVHAVLQRLGLTESADMADYHLLWGAFYLEQGELEKAEAACQNALDFTSVISRAAAYQALAQVYLRRHDYEGAIAVIEEALQVNPNFTRALLTLTKVYSAMGDKSMTNEIGGRLLEIWKHADPDFHPSIELRTLLGRKGRIARAAASETRDLLPQRPVQTDHLGS